MAISIHQTFKEQTKSWLATWMYVQLSVWLTTPFLAYYKSVINGQSPQKYMVYRWVLTHDALSIHKTRASPGDFTIGSRHWIPPGWSGPTSSPANCSASTGKVPRPSLERTAKPSMMEAWKIAVNRLDGVVCAARWSCQVAKHHFDGEKMGNIWKIVLSEVALRLMVCFEWLTHVAWVCCMSEQIFHSHDSKTNIIPVIFH